MSYSTVSSVYLLPCCLILRSKYSTTGFPFSLILRYHFAVVVMHLSKYYLSKRGSLDFFFFLDMDIPKVTPSNGLTPIENTRYRLNCIIATSNPSPVTKYQWFQNGMKIDSEIATLSFNSVKRDNSGSWFCKGIINQSRIVIEKSSSAIQVNVFCK